MAIQTRSHPDRGQNQIRQFGFWKCGDIKQRIWTDEWQWHTECWEI